MLSGPRKCFRTCQFFTCAMVCSTIARMLFKDRFAVGCRSLRFPPGGRLGPGGDALDADVAEVGADRAAGELLRPAAGCPGVGVVSGSVSRGAEAEQAARWW